MDYAEARKVAAGLWQSGLVSLKPASGRSAGGDLVRKSMGRKRTGPALTALVRRMVMESGPAVFTVTELAERLRLDHGIVRKARKYTYDEVRRLALAGKIEMVARGEKSKGIYRVVGAALEQGSGRSRTNTDKHGLKNGGNNGRRGSNALPGKGVANG